MRRARGRGGAALVAAVLALLVPLTGGCAGSSDRPGDDPAASPTTSEAPDASDTTGAADPTGALRERCLSAVPADAELQALSFAGSTGGDIEGARIGPSTNDRVAVLLPQVGGMCGWGRWAAAAAEESGLTSLLVNPCGYGESECTREEDADPLNEVAAAVEVARSDLGAERVVLLGTSMGGALTVIAVAAGADVDAWADVSGPSAWDGVELAALAPRLPGEGLVMMAPSDGQQAFTSARRLAAAAGVRFVPGRSGHGWELLVDPVDGTMTRLGRRLVEFSEGPPEA